MSQTQEEKHIAVLTERSRMQDALSAVDSLLTQVRQMRGMFDDKDGAIEAAVQAGEDVLNLTVPAKPITTQSKTWTPADCPNFTQLIAVTEALQEVHDEHVWDGGKDDPAHQEEDGNSCTYCAVLDAAKAQIVAHRAKIAAQPEPVAVPNFATFKAVAVALEEAHRFVHLGDRPFKAANCHECAVLDAAKAQIAKHATTAGQQ